MMTVGNFDTLEQAEARAHYYRWRGYRVAVVEHRSERAGSFIQLQCEQVPA